MTLGHHPQVIALLQEHFQTKPITGVEIGTAAGCLTKSILLYIPTVTKMYAIDPYIHDEKSLFEAHLPQDWHDDRRKQAEKAFAVYGERVTLLPITSNDAALVVPEVDFVWIDGDHTSSQIKLDIQNYYPKVKSGGIFGGHDYPLTKHLLTDFQDVHQGDDLTWWIFKP